MRGHGIPPLCLDNRNYVTANYRIYGMLGKKIMLLPTAPLLRWVLQPPIDDSRTTSVDGTKHALWVLLRFGREFQGKLARNPSQLRRPMVNRAKRNSQIVRITEVPAADKRNVFRNSQPGLEA